VKEIDPFLVGILMIDSVVDGKEPTSFPLPLDEIHDGILVLFQSSPDSVLVTLKMSSPRTFLAKYNVSNIEQQDGENGPKSGSWYFFAAWLYVTLFSCNLCVLCLSVCVSLVL